MNPCDKCALKWPGCGAATNVYASDGAVIGDAVFPGLIKRGCHTHHQPRQDSPRPEAAPDHAGGANEMVDIDEVVREAKKYIASLHYVDATGRLVKALLAAVEQMKGQGISSRCSDCPNYNSPLAYGHGYSMKEQIEFDKGKREAAEKERDAALLRVKELEEEQRNAKDLISSAGELVRDRDAARAECDRLKAERDDLLRSNNLLRAKNERLDDDLCKANWMCGHQAQQIIEQEKEHGELKAELAAANSPGLVQTIRQLRTELAEEKREHQNWREEADKWVRMYGDICRKMKGGKDADEKRD